MTQTSNDQTTTAAPAEQWVLLWSQSQNAFHVERQSEMLESNRRAYIEDRRMDYVPLVVGGSDEVSDAADACRATLIGRASAQELRLVA